VAAEKKAELPIISSLVSTCGPQWPTMNSYQLKTMLRAPISARARIGRYTRKLIERRLNAGAHGNPPNGFQ
jgi:hypothetical protein